MMNNKKKNFRYVKEEINLVDSNSDQEDNNNNNNINNKNNNNNNNYNIDINVDNRHVVDLNRNNAHTSDNNNKIVSNVNKLFSSKKRVRDQSSLSSLSVTEYFFPRKKPEKDTNTRLNNQNVSQNHIDDANHNSATRLINSPIDIDMKYDDSNNSKDLINNNGFNHLIPTDKEDSVSNESINIFSSPSFECGALAPYTHLSRCFHAIENETGRLLIINYLTLTYWHLIERDAINSLLPAVYLCTNNLGPAYENIQLGVGGSLVSKCILEVTGKSRRSMREDYNLYGDLGSLAQTYKCNQSMLLKPKPLTIKQVYESILSLADLVGPGNTKKKENVIKRLFISAREHEICYLVRTLLGDLRIGATTTSTLNALAKAIVLNAHYKAEKLKSNFNNKEEDFICNWQRIIKVTDSQSNILLLASKKQLLDNPLLGTLPTQSLQNLISIATMNLRLCYAQLPNFYCIIPYLLNHELNIFTLLNSIHLTPFTPCKPMLGKIERSIIEVLKRFGNSAFTAEVKYDGLRAQIHFLLNNHDLQGKFRVFSRHLQDQTGRWNDLTNILNKAKILSNPSSFIIDAEIVAVEKIRDSYKILPFQTLSTRKRTVINEINSNNNMVAIPEVSVMIYVFDIIYLNEISLLQHSFARRREFLYNTFVEIKGELQFVEHLDITQEESKLIKLDENKQSINTNTIQNNSIITMDSNNSDSEFNSDSETLTKDNFSHNQQLSLKQKIMVKSSSELSSSLLSLSKSKEEIVLLEDPHQTPIESGSNNNLIQNINKEEVSLKGSSKLYSLNDNLSDLSLISDPHTISIINRINLFLSTIARPRGEGLMCKSLSEDSTYEPDIRTSKWIKLKADYLSTANSTGLTGGINDSLDVIPIGAWLGQGRKLNWFSPILLAVYDPDTETYQSLCKCMSGFTDEFYESMTNYYSKHTIPQSKPYYSVAPDLTPSVWFEPIQVWEIRGSDLTISPNHTAAQGLIPNYEDRGISLRFPRFIRVREDKSIEQATTSQQIVDMYLQQTRYASQ